MGVASVHAGRSTCRPRLPARPPATLAGPPGEALMLQAPGQLLLVALAAGLAAGCGALGDTEVSSLDLSKLGPNEGYVVGTIHTTRTHDDGGLVTVDEHPDVTA